MGPIVIVAITLKVAGIDAPAHALVSTAALCSAVTSTVVLVLDFILRSNTVINQNACATWSLLCFAAAFDSYLRPAILEMYDGIHESAVPVVRVFSALLLSFVVVLDVSLQHSKVDTPLLLVIVFLSVVTHALELCNRPQFQQLMKTIFVLIVLVGNIGEIVYIVSWVRESPQTLDKAFHYCFLVIIGCTFLMNLVYEFIHHDTLRGANAEYMNGGEICGTSTWRLFVVGGAITSAASFYFSPSWPPLAYLAFFEMLLLALEVTILFDFCILANKPLGGRTAGLLFFNVLIALGVISFAIWAPFWVTRVLTFVLTCAFSSWGIVRVVPRGHPNHEHLGWVFLIVWCLVALYAARASRWVVFVVTFIYSLAFTPSVIRLIPREEAEEELGQ